MACQVKALHSTRSTPSQDIVLMKQQTGTVD